MFNLNRYKYIFYRLYRYKRDTGIPGFFPVYYYSELNFNGKPVFLAKVYHIDRYSAGIPISRRRFDDYIQPNQLNIAVFSDTL